MDSGNGTASILLLAIPLILLALMAFTQRKRAKAVADFQAALAVGDRVVTTSGILGTVRAINDGIVSLEIADGVQLRIDRRAIGMEQTPSTPTVSE
ncbi:MULTISPECIES: preprotein translocase subunit YajC [unclassified Janibacter]|uniref:preprotein translocase subunit YajC n=1 Tax=unclassified Janibacter TaxID=2649294 RepID=UPI003CFD0999